jgi:FKBP-type peptidyl-prolyl cis-trans isomerase FklB
MNYGWVRRASALAMVAVLAGPLAACDRGTAAPDETAAQNLRAAEFFLTSNARARPAASTRTVTIWSASTMRAP